MKQAISKKIALLAILGVSTSFACANDLMKQKITIRMLNTALVLVMHAKIPRLKKCKILCD